MKGTCTAPDCGRPVSRTWYCQTHYKHIRQGKALGPLRPRSAPGETLEERVARYTQKTETCWNWVGASRQTGYGALNISGRSEVVHRLIFTMAYGAIPAGLVIDHMCRNPRCIRPDHLQAVSNKQNGENLSGPHRDSRTGVRGVSFDMKTGRYRARVGHNGREYVAGYFDDLVEAGEAAARLRLELFDNSLADEAARFPSSQKDGGWRE